MSFQLKLAYEPTFLRIQKMSPGYLNIIWRPTYQLCPLSLTKHRFAVSNCYAAHIQQTVCKASHYYRHYKGK